MNTFDDIITLVLAVGAVGAAMVSILVLGNLLGLLFV